MKEASQGNEETEETKEEKRSKSSGAKQEGDSAASDADTGAVESSVTGPAPSSYKHVDIQL